MIRRRVVSCRAGGIRNWDLVDQLIGREGVGNWELGVGNWELIDLLIEHIEPIELGSVN